MEAKLPYEDIVSSKLSLMNAAEALEYLDRHSTRHVLQLAGVSDATVAEARAIVAKSAISVESWYDSGNRLGSVTGPAAAAVTSKWSLATSIFPPKETVKPSKPVTSWYDRGQRLVSESTFTPRAPNGWGLVPQAQIAEEMERLEQAAESLALSIVAAGEEANRLYLGQIRDRAKVASVKNQLALVSQYKTASAVAAASTAEEEVVASAPSAPPAAADAGNNGLLGGVAAVAVAAAAAYLYQTGGVPPPVDPSSVIAAAGMAGLS